MSASLTSQSGPFVQTSAPPGVINLGLGQPSPRLLPLAAIAEAAQAQLSGGDPLILQYGAVLGYQGFRASLAAFLAADYGQEIDADMLMVTGGISSALSLVSQVFARPGATVVCEDPTYFLANGVFESAGLQVRGVAVDEAGLRVDALAAQLEAGLRPAFVYCIPAFQNPSGACLSSERAELLLALAERYDFLVVADEPYVMLRYGELAPGSLTAHDRGRGRVLSLGSFSKILGPGLRLGWAHGSPALIERLSWHGSLRSGGCLNPLVAHLVHHTLDSGFLRGHVQTLREVLGGRSRTLATALGERLPEIHFIAPQGGYFCWLDLGRGVDAAAVLEGPAVAAQVRFIPGSRCAVEHDLGRFARLSFAFYEAQDLIEGVDRLARALRGG